MLKDILPYGELILLIVLTLMQAGAWKQKQQDTPETIAKDLRDLKANVESNYLDLRKLRHEWNNHLQTVDYKNDQRYVRRDVNTVEMKAIRDKQDSDCDRISELENWRNRTMGIS